MLGGRSRPAAPEWQAATPELRIECALAALDRLAKAASLAEPELAEALLQATRRLAMLLRQDPVREAVAQFVRAAAQRLPTFREPLRLEVHRVLNGEKKYWKELGTDDLAWLERFHGELEDKTPGGQLRQALAQPRWDRAPGDDGDLAPLAMALLADRTLLASEWEWLTSGEPVAVWDLGEALGRADSDEILLAEMLAKREGHGVRPCVQRRGGLRRQLDEGRRETRSERTEGARRKTHRLPHPRVFLGLLDPIEQVDRYDGNAVEPRAELIR